MAIFCTEKDSEKGLMMQLQRKSSAALLTPASLKRNYKVARSDVSIAKNQFQIFEKFQNQK